MKQYNQHFSFKGMQTDLAESLASSEYMTDAFNVRLTARKDNAAFIITNERGAINTNIEVEGEYLGHTLIDNLLVIFTNKGNEINPINNIYKVDLSHNECKRLVKDKNLGMTKEIKCIPFYESNSIIKVYWTDGINFPRVINVAEKPEYFDGKSSTFFDFWPEMKLEEKVSIKKDFIAKAEFNSGVIQYVLTYYNKYTIETKPFYTSPLLYISPKERGGEADEKVNCAFTVTITDVDKNFDGIKIYSLQRTSLNGTPIAKLVTEILLNKEGGNPSYEFIDNGIIGEIIDADYLLMKSSAEMFKAETFTQKDNVLFFGNITLNERLSSKDITVEPEDITCEYRTIYTKSRYLHGAASVKNIYESTNPSYKLEYIYSSQLTAYSDLNFLPETDHDTDEENSYKHSVPCAGFKQGNTYRLGLQFQDKYGNWTNPIFLADKKQDNYPTCIDADSFTDQVYEGINLPVFKYTLDTTNYKNYKKVRPLMVIPKESDREVICQGVLNPTMYIQEDKDKTQYSSWFFRPWPNTADIQYPFSCCPRFPNEYIGVPYGYHYWFYNHDILRNNPQAVVPCFSGCIDYPSYGVGMGLQSSSPNSYIGDKYGGNDGTQKVLDWDDTVDNADLDENDTYVLKNLSKGSIKKEGYGGLLRRTEIQGEHHDNHKFIVNDATGGYSTISSPDVEFSIDDFLNQSFNNNFLELVGNVEFRATFSHMHLYTSNDHVDDIGGFNQEDWEYISPGPYGIISGAYYWAYILDDASGYGKYRDLQNGLIWLLYLWHMEGTSIINDPYETYCKLDKKIISNLRYSVTNYDTEEHNIEEGIKAWVFNDDPVVCDNVDRLIYQGNVNVVQIPDGGYSKYFLRAGLCHRTDGDYTYLGLIGNDRDTNRDTYHNYEHLNIYNNTGFNFDYFNLVTLYTFDTEVRSDAWWKTYSRSSSPSSVIYKWYDFRGTVNAGTSVEHIEGGWQTRKTSSPYPDIDDIDNTFTNYAHDNGAISNTDGGHIALFNSGITRIKYKSTPHLVIDKSISSVWGNDRPIIDGSKTPDTLWDKWYLPVVELRQIPLNQYGGISDYAKRNNEWIPCGEPVSIKEDENKAIIEFSYGDTYFQRWDCLKTYPNDSSDRNQLVEIGSFMLETYVNIDGRTDKNRGQTDSTTMSPLNFNLMNPVYSQMDNIFTYRILDEDVEKNLDFPCQITWTLEKEPTATVDTWTNVTLATNYQVDGTKGAINELRTWRDNIIIFQDRSLSQLLYNERVQIQASDNVPIEIANSGKVQGARAISENVGCNNRKLITQTSAGLYFVDSVNNHLYYYGEGLKDLSNTLAMTKWFDNNYNQFDRLYLDDVNHDVYLSVLDDKIEEGKKSLRYSELLGQFTSFIGFKVPFMESHNDQIFALQNGCLYDMFKGNYNKFFPTESEEQSEENINWYIEFISNGKDQSMQDFDKMFSTIDYRADAFNDEEYLPDEQLTTLKVDNEYQSTDEIDLKRFINNTNHYKDTNLQKKFRIWRIQIPRNKNQEQGRIKDRIRNPWARFKLQCNNGFKTKLHDLNVQYFV